MKYIFRTYWSKYRPWISPWQLLQATIATLIIWLASLLPPRLASNAGSLLMRKIGPLLHWHRRGMANLLHVYPEMPQKDRRIIMHGVWDNIGRTIGEYACIRKVGPQVTVSGLENVPPEGTPVIFVTAHMANWEALAWFSRLCGRQLLDVYRRPNNVYLNKLLEMRSQGLPVKMVEKNNKAGLYLLRKLREGGAINLFVDQKGTRGDYLIPFLGKKALTIRAPALLAAKTGAMIIPGRMIRKNNHNLHIKIYPPLRKSTEMNDPKGTEVMQEINNIISGWVEETPEQWLWIHRRWKNAEIETLLKQEEN